MLYVNNSIDISLKEDICTITFIKQRYRQTKLTKLLHIKEETVKIYLPLDEFCIKYNDIGYINLGQNVDSYFYVKKYKNKNSC